AGGAGRRHAQRRPRTRVGRPRRAGAGPARRLRAVGRGQPGRTRLRARCKSVPGGLRRRNATMNYQLHRGTAPLLVSIPHMGTEIPQHLRGDYVERALEVEDADWHLDRLYAFARELGASVLQPTVSRYVVDLNRPPDDTPMYPGASNTELCPTRFFTGDALYREGCAVSAAEKTRRRETVWQPYHRA